jgi:hypothetical protein
MLRTLGPSQGRDLLAFEIWTTIQLWKAPSLGAAVSFSKMLTRAFSPGPLRIWRFRLGDSVKMKVFACDRVCEVKRRIEAVDGIPTADQRLCYGGRELPDDFILEDLGPIVERMRSETTVRLAVRLYNPIRISVQHLNGERFGLEVESSDLVSELKERIESQEGIRADDYDLFIGGQRMFREEVVCEWSIDSGFTLHLVLAQTDEGEPSVMVHAEERGENESLRLTIHDVQWNTFWTITARSQDRIADVWPRFASDPLLSGLWLGHVQFRSDGTFADYSIRDGMVLHFDNRMQIFVKTTTGVHVRLYVSPDDDIFHLKTLIEGPAKAPREEQRLIYAGKQLEDENQLRDYSIERDATIHLILRLLG